MDCENSLDTDAFFKQTTELNTMNRLSYLNLFTTAGIVAIISLITYTSFRDGSTLFAFHPFLSTIGWMLMITAINALTPGDLATTWLPIRLRSTRHWFLQTLSTSFILAGFVIILYSKISKGKYHFVSLHAKFGLAAYIFMFINVFFGVAVLYSHKLRQLVPPFIIRQFHSLGGIVTLSIGIATLGLGFFTNWWSLGDNLRYACLAVIVLLTLLTVLRPSLKIYFRIRELLSINC